MVFNLSKTKLLGMTLSLALLSTSSFGMQRNRHNLQSNNAQQNNQPNQVNAITYAASGKALKEKAKYIEKYIKSESFKILTKNCSTEAFVEEFQGFLALVKKNIPEDYASIATSIYMSGKFMDDSAGTSIANDLFWAIVKVSGCKVFLSVDVGSGSLVFEGDGQDIPCFNQRHHQNGWGN